MATAGLLIATMDETINSLQEFIAVNSKGIKWTGYLAISFVSSRDEADPKWFCREWLYAYAYGVLKVMWEVKWGGYCYISHLCRKDTEESCSSKYTGAEVLSEMNMVSVSIALPYSTHMTFIDKWKK